MNPLQQKELEMLKIFVEICDKLGLKYYLVCGSALGAVKYGGFIPWDDDIDVALTREDYRVFCQEAQALLPEGIFLQTHETDPRYPWISAKLRDSRTTYIETPSREMRINHGVYLDVFPLDGYPTRSSEIRKLEIYKDYQKLLLLSAYRGTYSLKVRILLNIFRFLGVHRRTAKIVSRLQKALSAYSTEGSVLWCNHANWQGKLEYAPREHYGQGRMVKFEGLDVRVPEKYDEYLTQKYGDWRADLPEEQKVGHHYYEIMDLEKSYIEYMQE